jgi:hypothetical protein
MFSRRRHGDAILSPATHGIAFGNDGWRGLPSVVLTKEGCLREECFVFSSQILNLKLMRRKGNWGFQFQIVACTQAQVSYNAEAYLCLLNVVVACTQAQVSYNPRANDPYRLRVVACTQAQVSYNRPFASPCAARVCERLELK